MTTVKPLTQAFIRTILDYDPATGIFRWKVNRPPRGRISEIAGYDNGSGYQKICIGGNRYYNHRLAFLWMKGYLPEEVDHINQCRGDNRWINLREANRKMNRANVSGWNGVRKRHGRWYARAARTHIGVFETEAEAHAACRQFLQENYGDFSPKCRPPDPPAQLSVLKGKIVHQSFLYKGKTLSEWARETGIPQPTLHWRIVKKGMDPEEAMKDRRL